MQGYSYVSPPWPELTSECSHSRSPADSAPLALCSTSTATLDSDPPWRPLASQYLALAPTALAFDPVSPLLFTASPTGTITSYFCSPTTGLGGRYTSYHAHWGAVGECTIDNTGILSVGGGMGGGRPGSGGSIKMATRRGLALWTIE